MPKQTKNSDDQRHLTVMLDKRNAIVDFIESLKVEDTEDINEIKAAAQALEAVVKSIKSLGDLEDANPMKPMRGEGQPTAAERFSEDF